MPAPTNPFKRALKDNALQLGCCPGPADPYGAEISAGAGFDGLPIDGAPAPNDLCPKAGCRPGRRTETTAGTHQSERPGKAKGACICRISTPSPVLALLLRDGHLREAMALTAA